MSIFWSELTQKLDPYVPGEQPKDRKYIKLNTNENPYGPSPRVLEAIRQAADDSLRLYPDPTCDALLTAASEYYGVSKSRIFAGNGSDEVLAFAFMAFFDPGKPVLFPDITYSFYPVYASLFNLDYRLIPLEEDFSIPVEQLCHSEGGVILANPNAPTGKYLDLADVRRILENNPSRVVLVDEAYIEFGGESAVSLVDQYPNLLVVQTLSKSHGLAGMRIGFAIGQEELIDGINRVKNSFNSYTLDRLALAAGVEALRDKEYARTSWQKVMATRDRVTEGLKGMGFQVIDSMANFIFISHPQIKAAELFKELRDKGVLVRYFNKPRLDNRLRVSIGTDEEMEAFLRGVRESIGEK